MTEATEDEDWLVECSDEEFKNSKDPWEPEPSEIDRLYTLLEKGELPELKWSCPGYRAPSPEMPNTPQEKEEKKIEEQDDFDFMDEATTPKLKIRNKGEETLKGSAKKKTTSLDGVLSTMKKHHLLPSNVK